MLTSKHAEVPVVTGREEIGRDRKQVDPESGPLESCRTSPVGSDSKTDDNIQCGSRFLQGKSRCL